MIKKLLMQLCLALLFFGTCFAGTATVDFVDKGNAGYRYFEINVTGDGNATAIDFANCVDSDGVTQNYTERLIGYYIYRVKTKPGTGAATPAAYTVSVADGDGDAFLSIPARSTTAAEWYKGYLTTSGQYEVLIDGITVTVSEDIDTADTTFIRVVLGKWRD
jgi:hypothetical protein